MPKTAISKVSPNHKELLKNYNQQKVELHQALKLLIVCSDSLDSAIDGIIDATMDVLAKAEEECRMEFQTVNK